MRNSKKKRYILIIMSIIMIVSMCLGSVLSVFAFNPSADDTTSFTQYQDSMIYVHPECAYEDIQAYTTVYNQVPGNVIQCLTQAGIKIYMLPYTGPDPDNPTICATAYPPLYEIEPKSQKITGIKRYGWITCYTELEYEDFAPEQLIYAIGCELDYITAYNDGHYTSFPHGISDATEWNQIYNIDNKDELSNIRTYDDLSQLNWPLTAADGFADAFRLYICHYEDLTELSTLVSNFFNTWVASINIDTLCPIYESTPDNQSITAASVDIQDADVNTIVDDTDISAEASTSFIVEDPAYAFKRPRINIQLPNIKINWRYVSIGSVVIITLFVLYWLTGRLKIYRQSRKAQSDYVKQLEHKFNTSTIYTYQHAMKWKNTKPVPGLYQIDNSVLQVHTRGYTSDLFNDIYTHIHESEEKIVSINSKRAQQYWQIKYLCLPPNLDQKTLQKLIKHISE